MEKGFTINACCSRVNIISESQTLTFGEHLFLVTVVHCSNCGSIKATTNIKEHKMAGDTIIVEKAGKTLKAEYFTTTDGCGCRFFINEEFIQEELYQGKSITWAESAASNWLSGVKTLNG
jgi:hypothetical protein